MNKVCILISMLWSSYFICSCSFLNSKTINNKELVGHWQKHCNGESGYIEIIDSCKTSILEVNSNQIIIEAKINTIIQNGVYTLDFYHQKPVDLGSGGARLNWDDFSNDSIIMKMEIIDKDKAKITWLGFYDKVTKKRVWKDGFDILDDNRDITSVEVIKCN